MWREAEIRDKKVQNLILEIQKILVNLEPMLRDVERILRNIRFFKDDVIEHYLGRESLIPLSNMKKEEIENKYELYRFFEYKFYPYCIEPLANFSSCIARFYYDLYDNPSEFCLRCGDSAVEFIKWDYSSLNPYYIELANQLDDDCYKVFEKWNSAIPKINELKNYVEKLLNECKLL